MRKLWGFVNALGMILVAIGFFAKSAVPIILGIVLAMLGQWQKGRAEKEHHASAQSASIRPALNDVFDTVDYRPDERLTVLDIDPMQLLLHTSYHYVDGSDKTTATYHGLQLLLGNVRLMETDTFRDEETNMETTSVTSSWRGFWLIAELDRTLPCDLRIIPRGALEKLIRTRGVRTGDEAFDKGYIVFSDNEEEVLRVLTPHMREALVRLLELLGKNGGISFRVEGKVHLAAGGRQLFVPDRGITDVAMTRMKFAKELHWVTTLLDEVGPLRTLYGRG